MYRIGFLTILAALAFIMSGTDPVRADDGSCNFTMQNMFAGPYKVCRQPASAEACTALGTTDDNKDAVHSDSACSSESSVGSCVTTDGAVIYYEGDPSGLEIGCGFQAGTWEAAGE